MDFSGVTIDTADQVSAHVRYVLGLNLSPTDKVDRIADVLEFVGRHFHGQLYGAASEVFDSTAMSSTGLDDANGQARRLAIKIVRNDSLARDTSAVLVTEYYNSILGQAQHEAFHNAVSMQKHPTLTRRAFRGKPDCKWCQSKSGTYTNPSPEDFGRHDKCDCLFEVSGYNSRNGLLKNYNKKG